MQKNQNPQNNKDFFAQLNQQFNKAISFIKALPDDEKIAYGAMLFGLVFLIIFLAI